MHEDQGVSRSDRPHEEGLAQRLDRLTREDAERVLESAIHLQSQRHAAETFTSDQVRLIARELGLEDALVDRAIREEMSRRNQQASALEGRAISGSAPVRGPRREVESRVMGWMETEEGLRPVARTERGVRWERDSHWLTSTRLALGTEATKALRGMPEVAHRLTLLQPDEHLVEIEVETGRIRHTAWGVGGGVAAAGAGGGALAAALVPGGNDLLQFLSVAGPAVVAAAASGVLTARLWAGSIRKGVDKALSGIAHPDLHPKAARRRERRRRRGTQEIGSRRQRLVDEVADAIDQLFH